MNFQLAYVYAGSRAGAAVRGLVYAGSAMRARARLRRMGIGIRSLRVAPWSTVTGWLSPSFSTMDLEHFYAYMARVSDKGLSRVETLGEAVDFVEDQRLRFAIAMARDSVQSGEPLSKALAAAGFPERDVHLIASGEQSGKIGQVLAALAREVKRESEQARLIRRALLPLAIVLGMAYVLAYGAVAFLAPLIGQKFAANAALFRIPPYAQAYYDFAAWFKQNLFVMSALYVAAGVALVWLLRSRACRLALEAMLPTVRQLIERAEMARLWGMFSMMSDSGVHLYDIARALARAATRGVTRERFAKLEKQFKLGVDLDLAVERAGFPRYIVSGVRAARSSNSIPEGTRDLADRLSIQTGILTNRVHLLVVGLSALLGAFVVLGFFAVTLLPQMSAVLNSL